jgi:hypothetical protein
MVVVGNMVEQSLRTLIHQYMVRNCRSALGMVRIPLPMVVAMVAV